MRSNTTRIAVAVGAVVVLVVLFVILNGGDDNKDSKSSNNATVTTGQPPGGNKQAVIDVQGGKPVGGIQKLSYTKGDQVRFKVNSDVADEIHVHGYDFHKDVPAGGSVTFSFKANIEGVFVIELEAKGEQIAQLTVKPS
jgi:hypothetical protein